MPEQSKDIDRLDDISKFCELIIEKTKGLTWKEFDNDELIRWAL